MKKTLPIIVILTTLSLVGLLLLQASWLNNLLALRKGQLNNKINEAGVSVAVELYNASTTVPSLRVKPAFGFNRFGSSIPMLLNPPTVDEKFKPEDIHEKLEKAFKKEDLQYIKFEFAVINNS